jgi:hypothetical protein
MSLLLALKVQKGKSVLRGIDHFWNVIMDLHRHGKPFSIRIIDQAGNADESTVRDFVKRLVAANFIEQVEGAALAIDVLYRPIVIQSAAPRIRRDGSVIEAQPANRAMWNMMRGPSGRSGFTYKDLVAWGSTDEVPIAPATAKTYIHVLSQAGYLICLLKGTPGKAAVWRLDPKMNSGPEAPKVLRSRLIYDPNRSEVVGDVIAEEESL